MQDGPLTQSADSATQYELQRDVLRQHTPAWPCCFVLHLVALPPLCRELGQDEQLHAAGLMWAHLVQPIHIWEEVLPLALRPSQQKQLKRM